MKCRAFITSQRVDLRLRRGFTGPRPPAGAPGDSMCGGRRESPVLFLFALLALACSPPALELTIDRNADREERLYWHAAVAELEVSTGVDWLVHDGDCGDSPACAFTVDEFTDSTSLDAGTYEVGRTRPHPTVLNDLDAAELRGLPVDLAVAARIHELGHLAGLGHTSDGVFAYSWWDEPCLTDDNLDEFCALWPCLWREPSCNMVDR